MINYTQISVDLWKMEYLAHCLQPPEKNLFFF